MKTRLMGIMTIALAGALMLLAPCQDTLAVSGCCKQKVGNDWRKSNHDFESCSVQNESDGDNVFEPKGKWWWDVSC